MREATELLGGGLKDLLITLAVGFLLSLSLVGLYVRLTRIQMKGKMMT